MASKVFPIVSEVARKEFGEQTLFGQYRPASPSDLWPQMSEAVLRGCTCPKEENERRLKAGQQAMLSKTCRVHSKLCQADPCGHGEHVGAHLRCEHCTNVLQMCVVCEAVYLEDGDDPTIHGWVLELVDPKVVGWRCPNCAGGGFRMKASAPDRE